MQLRLVQLEEIYRPFKIWGDPGKPQEKAEKSNCPGEMLLFFIVHQ